MYRLSIFVRIYKMTKKTLTLSIDNKVYEQLQKFKKKNPEFNTSYRVEKYLTIILAYEQPISSKQHKIKFGY